MCCLCLEGHDGGGSAHPCCVGQLQRDYTALHPRKLSFSGQSIVIMTLIHCARSVCDTSSLPQELKFLQETFRNNGYNHRQILHALNPPTRSPPPREEDHTLVAFLPFVDTTFNHTSRVLSKHNIKTVGLPPWKLSSFFILLGTTWP
jgi:hypothetical protein